MFGLSHVKTAVCPVSRSTEAELQLFIDFLHMETFYIWINPKAACMLVKLRQIKKMWTQDGSVKSLILYGPGPGQLW